MPLQRGQTRTALTSWDPWLSADFLNSVWSCARSAPIIALCPNCLTGTQLSVVSCRLSATRREHAHDSLTTDNRQLTTAWHLTCFNHSSTTAELASCS